MNAKVLKWPLAIVVVAFIVVSVGELCAGQAEYFRTDTQAFRASATFGKQMFDTYQCARCHATRVGQPLNKDIIAPNLTLAKNRLRPAWILQWLLDPQTLQPGTKMPNFFNFNEDDDYNPIYSDEDAHMQYQIVVALRDYLMVMGTDFEFKR